MPRKRLSKEIRDLILQDLEDKIPQTTIIETYSINAQDLNSLRATLKTRIIYQYLCLNCNNRFKSNLTFTEAYCPGLACNKSTKIRKLKWKSLNTQIQY